MLSERQILFFASLFGILLAIPQPSSGQGQDERQDGERKYKTLQYEFGKVIEGLPYGRKFYLSGPLKEFNQPKAEIVILDIYEINSPEDEDKKFRPGDGNHVYNGYYWDNPDAPDPNGNFRIFVDKPLKLEQRYRLDFQYFNTYEISGGQDIVLAFQGVLDSVYYADKEISSADLDFALDETRRKLSAQYEFGQLGFDLKGNYMLIAREMKPITFPIKTGQGLISQNELLELARAKYNLRNSREGFEAKQRGLLADSLIPNYRKLVNELNALLFKKLADPASLPDVLYVQEDIEALKAFAETQTLQAASPFGNFRSMYGKGLLSEDAQATLIVLDQGYSALRRANESMAANSEKIRRTEERIGTVEQIVLTGFRLTGNTRALTSSQAPSKTELQNLRVGTAVGGSLAALNSTSNNSGASQVDPFSYAGLKFFFRPVDKGLPNPYIAGPRPLNRMAFLLGLQVGDDLAYRGQPLDNLLGIKPVLGFSYDASPFLGIELGTVFFEQSSISPVLDERKPRVAPFISISLDPDMLNRFQSLITNDPYKIPSQ